MKSNSVEREVHRQLGVMRSGAVELYGEDELRTRLAEALGEKRPLRVKLGMDPSAPDLHLGHTVVLQKLERIQSAYCRDDVSPNRIVGDHGSNRFCLRGCATLD